MNQVVSLLCPYGCGVVVVVEEDGKDEAYGYDIDVVASVS